MNITIFITLVTALSLVSSLFTEAVKKAFKNPKPNLTAIIISCIVGWGGGAAAYVFMNIPFNLSTIICLGILAPTIWLCATLGYDKVKETIEEILFPKK
jgi:hypothetical protein